MSRRPPNPAAERAAQNTATIKSLLKLEANKVCADCKRNKHPRWASWNLGIFICIRCSGIHRGMGTHISRVKSVDLDSWTDEQLQSILSWGNARANKYWEAKLAPGHAPSESKIENFIRTKYELKRWVMDGPIPDPATLGDEADDDIPLSVVKEKKNIERRESVRKGSVGQSAAPRSIQPSAPQPDLIGGDPIPQRASTAGPTASKVPPKAQPAPPKATSTKDSLLGLDFLGTEPAAPPRPASTTGTPGVGNQSRPDLKQSILSLYATAPRPQQQQQQQQQQHQFQQQQLYQQQQSHNHSGSMSGMPSPTGGMSQNHNPFGGFNDAFSSLSFSGPAAAPAVKSPKVDAFSSLGSFSSPRPAPASSASAGSAFSSLSGGGFFDAKPATAPSAHQPKQSIGSPRGAFGAFGSPVAAPAPAPAPAPRQQSSFSAAPAPSSALNDLFDFSTSSPPRAAPAPKPAAAAPASSSSAFSSSSVFNLSTPTAQPKAPAAAAPQATASSNAWGNSDDVWGGNAWSTTAEAPKRSPEASRPSVAAAAPPIALSNDFGWGAPAASSFGGAAPTTHTSSLASQPIVLSASGGFAPKVAADEEFGGWSTPAPSGPSSGSAKPAAGGGGFGASEDLFSNVWE
ncbi:putative GTPase activating protein for Arf-domain-containing protein [Bombardia bombarda]|uniref:GTPase activating protein for Arf-domain-containing protein n=1 Tax=Bombardia bombarda TaxID=252184 RepID=A0AA39X9A7_9PEZI|nr:putative GTPase activating protein for Arf-domain-containing protein [Bombardia bombarda]